MEVIFVADIAPDEQDKRATPPRRWPSWASVGTYIYLIVSNYLPGPGHAAGARGDCKSSHVRAVLF